MANISPWQGIGLLGRAVRNYLTNRLIIVSYEVTLSCNCNCRHCDLGGVIEDEKQITPEEYGHLTERLKPLAAQVSGGEPLLRKDLTAIVKAIKQAGVHYIILVTNGGLLSEGNYLHLREAGVNQFSVSLDFPDERHDEFRRRPGLYKRLNESVPRLAELGFGDIILNTAITKANLKEILPLARQAAQWGVDISYSAYTALRTGNEEYCLKSREDLGVLRQAVKDVIGLKGQGIHLANPERTLRDTLRFFERGYMPNCKAGRRFLVVMPDGGLVPCSHHRIRYTSQKEMAKKFSRTNRCGSCYVAIRSYNEMSFLSQVKNIPNYKQHIVSH